MDNIDFALTRYHSAGMNTVTAIILAGGRGTRLAGLHPHLPKPMIPVAGKPFLYWVTAWLVAQGVQDFVYSAGHLADVVVEWAAQEGDFPTGVTRRVVREESPLGTGGGIIHCLPAAQHDTVIALNGDSLLLTDISPLSQSLDSADMSLLGVWCADTTRYGSLDCDADGRLLAFREKQAGSGYINGGLYGFRKALLGGFSDYPLSMEVDILPSLLGEGKKLAVTKVTDAPFLDIGLPETLSLADDFIRQNKGWFRQQ